MKKIIQLLIIILLSLIIFVIGLFVYTAYTEYQARKETIQMFIDMIDE